MLDGSGSRIGVMIGCISCALVTHALFADSPFALRVIDYEPGIGLPIDSITGVPFDNSARALGPPTIDTTGDGWLISPLAPLPVTPVYPAFRDVELVTIGVGGHLTLEFEPPILDHPLNPYGLDFIVYGNAWIMTPSPGAYGTNDPSGVLLGSFLVEEPGTVSVSADGTNWFSYTDGPFADSFAPTLGRRYNPAAPEPALGGWNAWWGEPTDPRLPLDPAMRPEDLANQTLAFAAQAYGASAGGTGFDIGGFDLPLDPETGHKFIRFVCIENLSPSATPEIDAVAAVAPVSAYRHWALHRFSWQQRMSPGIDHPAADPNGNGIPNLLAFLFDLDPHTPDARPLFALSMVDAGGQPLVQVQYRVRHLPPGIALRVERTENHVAWQADAEAITCVPDSDAPEWQVCTATWTDPNAVGSFRLVAEVLLP